MSALADLPDDWEVWHEADEGRVVVVFRPDVFDSSQYPAECLPTIYVSQRPPQERLPRLDAERSDWFVALTLEPEVRVREVDGRFESRADALAAAVDVAEAFAAGDVDYRAAYQVPREDYFAALDDLTG